LLELVVRFVALTAPATTVRACAATPRVTIV
jgi:hypothetical protein